MPHKSESGKIITSKTPLLSSSTKISSSSCSSSNQNHSLKMKTKSATGDLQLTGSPADPTVAVMLKNGQSEQQHHGLLELSSSETDTIEVVHSNLINGNSSNQTETGDNLKKTTITSLSSATNGAKVEDEDKEEDSEALANGQESPSLKNGFLHFHPQIKEQCDVPCRKDFIKTLDEEEGISRPKKIYRVVLTGGKQTFNFMTFFISTVFQFNLFRESSTGSC